jgi:hypothetical protein
MSSAGVNQVTYTWLQCSPRTTQVLVGNARNGWSDPGDAFEAGQCCADEHEVNCPVNKCR